MHICYFRLVWNLHSMEKGRGLEPSLAESANHSRASRVAIEAEKEETNKPKKNITCNDFV